MDEKRFCGVACTIVGAIGGIVVAHAIGPLALAMPPLWGLFGYKMAQARGPGETADGKTRGSKLVNAYGNTRSAVPYHQEKPLRERSRNMNRESEFLIRALDALSSFEDERLLGRRGRRTLKRMQALRKKIPVKNRGFVPGLPGARGTPDSRD